MNARKDEVVLIKKPAEHGGQLGRDPTYIVKDLQSRRSCPRSFEQILVNVPRVLAVVRRLDKL